MKHFISLGTQFIGYRDTVEDLKGKPSYDCDVFTRHRVDYIAVFDFFLPCFLPLEALAKVNKRADDLAANLEQSEKARKKAEQDAASVGDLRKRLHQSETALSEKTTQQIAREEAIIGRLESQNQRFVSKFTNHFARVPSKIYPPYIC
jgi:hypothetical protein